MTPSSTPEPGALDGESVKLLPCPFCGEPGAIDNEKGWSVGCFRDACGCEPFTGFFETRESAVAAWNRRTHVPAHSADAGDVGKGGKASADGLFEVHDFAALRPSAGAGGLEEALRDPNTVHINMLRGGIAKLTPAQIGHLYRGEEAATVVSEIIRQNPEIARPDPETEGLREAISFLKVALDFAYEQGLHEVGYDPIERIRQALQTTEGE